MALDDDNDAERLDPDLLRAGWPAATPPPGFADRVLRARAAETPPAAPARRTGSRRLRHVALALTIAAAVAGFWVFTRPDGQAAGARGEWAGDARSSLRVGRRGVAVAEPGAALSWTVAPDGAARVTQARGDVFYRVEPGGPFVVTTPAGDVVVRGTCFRVEVDPMKKATQTALAAGAGAAVTAAILVTVYEGRVTVDSAHGKSEVAAGESVRVGGGDSTAAAGQGGAGRAALLAPPASDASRDELLRRDHAHRQEIASLDARLRRLEREPGAAPAPPGGDEGPRRRRILDGDQMFDIPPEEWAEMAKNCELRYDLPGYGLEPPEVTAKMAEQVGLGEEERAAVNELLRRLNDAHLAELRQLYIEATGDTAGATSLEPQAMATEIMQKSGEREASEARRRIALERAGQATPPADPRSGPVVERFFRLAVGAGDAFEGELAKVIGAERARALRERDRSAVGLGGCAGEDEAQER